MVLLRVGKFSRVPVPELHSEKFFGKRDTFAASRADAFAFPVMSQSALEAERHSDDTGKRPLSLSLSHCLLFPVRRSFQSRIEDID